MSLVVKQLGRTPSLPAVKKPTLQERTGLTVKSPGARLTHYGGGGLFQPGTISPPPAGGYGPGCGLYGCGCPDGQAPNKGRSECFPSGHACTQGGSCDPGWHESPEDCRCYPDEPTCPEGQLLVDGECKPGIMAPPTEGCPVGYERAYGGNQCVWTGRLGCGAGEEEVAGVCVPSDNWPGGVGGGGGGGPWPGVTCKAGYVLGSDGQCYKQAALEDKQPPAGPPWFEKNKSLVIAGGLGVAALVVGYLLVKRAK